MDRREYLAGMHQCVIAEFIGAVVEEWAGDRSPLEQNLLAGVLRSQLESQFVPGLTAVLALHMEADAQMLGQGLPGWLDLTSTAMPAESAFLTEMGRRVDPIGAVLLEENCCLLPGESLGSQAFRCHLLEMVPLASRLVPGG